MSGAHEKNTVSPSTTMGSLECDAVEVALARGPTLAQVTATLRPGRFTAVLGPNGAGKSTLLSLLSGERVPRQGSVRLDGQSLTHWAAQTLALRRAVMPQDTAVAFDFTVREVVELGRLPHRTSPGSREEAIVAGALAATGVGHLAQRGISQLSGGERARVHLARALAQIWEPCPQGHARWLLLDEPTAALDLAHQHQALGWVRRWAVEQNVGVVAVLHDLNLALRYAHDALLLGHGCSQMGATADVLHRESIARVWGVESSAVFASDGIVQYLFTKN